ncbi:MAG: lasso RiPP family leader peptide-containing protein [Oscillatoria sp. PMC 1068.18]|nr:lasso RiPP family leader peptide-containing protein [Oscillatoria sp. PMC 1076.18]MEC4991833.1 lasso RiPP family leader peptide-containing protein [Oscillatoria sp. PMC 1068.18]
MNPKETPNSKQSEETNSRLAYETPKLKKHGTIDDLTLAIGGPGGGDGVSDYADTPIS